MMIKLDNRSQLMKHFGAEQKNTVWSWCAVNEATKSVYLSVWDDYRNTNKKITKVHYLLQEQDWGVNDETSNFSPARKDHDKKLSLILEEGYKAFGYFVTAKDKHVLPREIETTKTSFIFSLELDKLEDGTVIGYPIKRIEVK